MVSYFKIQRRDSNENVTNKKSISKTIDIGLSLLYQKKKNTQEVNV